jgi:hypothetical protein
MTKLNILNLAECYGIDRSEFEIEFMTHEGNHYWNLFRHGSFLTSVNTELNGAEYRDHCYILIGLRLVYLT